MPVSLAKQVFTLQKAAPPTPHPQACALGRGHPPGPHDPRVRAWIAQQIEDEACVAGPSPACSGIPAARQGRGAPRRRESGRKPAFPSRPPGSESGLGIGPPPEDRGQAAWQSRHGEGPFSAARRSPGAAPALPNIVQHPASALAAAPGARRPLLAALAPSEPCGPRARAGRAPPRRAPLPTSPGRPGRLLPASLARLGLSPTPVLAPIVHGCKTPGLGLRVCGRMCARGSLRAPPLRTGTRAGGCPTEPMPGTQGSTLTLGSVLLGAQAGAEGPPQVGEACGRSDVFGRTVLEVPARPSGLHPGEVPDVCSCAARGLPPRWGPSQKRPLLLCVNRVGKLCLGVPAYGHRMLWGSEGPLDEKLKAWVEDGILVSPFIYQLSNFEKYNLPHFLDYT